MFMLRLLASTSRKKTTHLLNTAKPNTTENKGKVIVIILAVISCNTLLTKLSLLHKIDQGIVAIPATVYLQPVTGYTTRGHNRKFVVPQSRINAYRHSFFPSTIMLWNSLPTSVVMSSSLATFQTNLAATHLLPIPTV